jgi:hypothetical protein
MLTEEICKSCPKYQVWHGLPEGEQPWLCFVESAGIIGDDSFLYMYSYSEFPAGCLKKLEHVLDRTEKRSLTTE